MYTEVSSRYTKEPAEPAFPDIRMPPSRSICVYRRGLRSPHPQYKWLHTSWEWSDALIDVAAVGHLRIYHALYAMLVVFKVSLISRVLANVL